jgi:WXXGXW repeat (2 copies)
MKGSIVRRMVLAMFLAAFSAASFAQVAIGVSVRIGPPALPVYAQPICPSPGYIWTPGYWAWNDAAGYYWVPGTWVLAPVGMLWTPGYWGWGGGLYAWHPGYWGPHIGFYGGINYGYGYTGVGFVGGEWRGGAFYYNRSVTNVSVTNVTNVYNRTVVVNNTTVRNVSYNGGSGGVMARPTAQEEAFARERHTAPLAVQMQHQQMASQNRQNFASVNQGRPAIAATARPADFSGRSVVAARAAGGQYHPPAMSPKEARVNTPQPAANRSTPSAANRPASVPPNHSNEGFRPFTPPSKNATPAANNANHSNPSGGNSNRPNSNEGFRSFTPPANNHANENRPSQSAPNESRPQEHSNAPNNARPAPSHEAPHQSAPRSNPGSEHHQAPPKEERR